MIRKKLNIKRLRNLLKATQEDFGQQFGMNRGTYANHEAKNKFPDEFVRDVWDKYESLINENISFLEEPTVSYETVEALQIRIGELSELLKQKDVIIENQRQVIEMMNKTFELQKAQKNSKL